MNKHPGGSLKKIAFNPTINMSNYQVENIHTSFTSVDLFGQANYIKVEDIFEEGSKEYKVTFENHFQGVVRHRKGEYFYFSGDEEKVGSHLFIAKIEGHVKSSKGNRSIKGPIRSNLINSRSGSDHDRLIDLFIIDPVLYHAGGISLMGDIIVVPLESKEADKGKIVFVDVSKPEHPSLIKTHIKANGKAGAAACIKLSNGHFLTVSWTENKGRHFDIYLSNKNELGGPCQSIRVDIKDMNNVDKKEKPRFQAIQFIKDGKGDLYMIGSDSRLKIGGQNRLYLLKWQLDKSTMSHSNPVLNKPTITIIKTVFPKKGHTFYKFNSCGGIYVDEQKRLVVYGGGKSRGGKKAKYMKLCEFYERISSKDEPVHKGGIIELYTEPKYQGRSLIIDLDIHDSIANYHNVEVPGATIDDKIKSLKYLLPKGTEYTLYQDKNYNIKKGRPIDPKKKILKLKGTGKIEFISDLSDKKWTNKKAISIKISSSQQV